MNKLTDRQIQILKIIIDEYTLTGEPVGSKLVSEKYSLGVSAQTIRNEMACLEKHKLLEKTHTSSGRIPSKHGLKFYDEHLALPQIDNIVKQRLKAIFIKRDDDIDTVISDSLTMLSEITKLPSVANTYVLNETLREVSLVQLDETNALMLIITNLGNIYKNYIHITNQSQFDDVKVCIRLFNKHLIGTELIRVEEKIKSLEPIIRQQVHQYEFITKEIITKLFNNTIKHVQKTNVVGVTKLFEYPEFHDPDLLYKIMKMLETGNIWRQIQHDFDEENRVSIEFTEPDKNKHNTIAIASTKIRIGTVERQISVVGPSRIQLSKIKGILNYLKSQIEEMFSEDAEKTLKDSNQKDEK